MKEIMLKDCAINKEKLNNIIALAVFGSYHEDAFDKNRSDIDIMILSSKELDFEEEFDIEDYLQSILPEYFNHNDIHYTFINDFNYPFSELFLISKDKLILKDEEFLDYTLGYSVYKRDREPLEIMRNENLKDLEVYRNGLL